MPITLQEKPIRYVAFTRLEWGSIAILSFQTYTFDRAHFLAPPRTVAGAQSSGSISDWIKGWCIPTSTSVKVQSGYGAYADFYSDTPSTHISFCNVVRPTSSSLINRYFNHQRRFSGLEIQLIDYPLNWSNNRPWLPQNSELGLNRRKVSILIRLPSVGYAP